MGIGDKSHAILAELQNKVRHQHSSAAPGRGLLAKWRESSSRIRHQNDQMHYCRI